MTDFVTHRKLRVALEVALDSAALEWFMASLAVVADRPGECAVRFAGASRRCGRADLTAGAGELGWRADEAVRVLLLNAVAAEQRLTVAQDIYTHGDPAERRAVLKALALLDLGPEALSLVEDAIRTNDSTLIRSALGPFAARHLPQPALRQAILKCAFLSVPFRDIPEVLRRSDDQVVTMLIDFVRERIVAGRDVDGQILDVIAARPGLLAAAGLTAEVESPVGFRAAAARRVADRLAAAGTGHHPPATD